MSKEESRRFGAVAVVPALLLAVQLAACARVPHAPAGSARTPWTFEPPSPSPTPISVLGLPVAPSPLPWPTANPALMKRAIALRVCRSASPSDAITAGANVYVGCYDGKLLRLSAVMRPIRSVTFSQSRIRVRRAGAMALAISWVDDGATMVNRLRFVDSVTLKPIVDSDMAPDGMNDTTFLGTLGNRAYLDDTCCFGRPDVYEPATIYSVSLADGSVSKPVELRPDPAAHPGNAQPLGQGEWNYLIAKNLYVIVQHVTYRYDVTHLRRAPVRMKTSSYFRDGMAGLP